MFFTVSATVGTSGSKRRRRPTKRRTVRKTYTRKRKPVRKRTARATAERRTTSRAKPRTRAKKRRSSWF